MKQILIASDLSEKSGPALQRAVALARQFGSRLTVVHVLDEGSPPTEFDHERSRVLAALREELRRAGGDHLGTAAVPSIAVGDPSSAIADAADRLEADLVVMGRPAQGGLGGLIGGTTVRRVMGLGARPVLMVNEAGEAPYSKVLAAIDLSDASANALRTARILGLLDPSRDAAVHGFLPLGEGMMYYAGIEREKIDDHVAVSASQARQAVSRFLRKYGFEKLENFLLVEKGTPFEAIQEGIDRVEADLLVIGTRGHGGFKRVLLGSVADEVIQGVRCDVLAVPPSDKSVK